jgi:segregation and condensation protein A
MSVDIHVDSFEGPLDLLLHLTKKNDIEISEIKISEITAEYLNYLSLMKELNVEIAGEFLVMAVSLMQIKSRTLLPSNNEENSEDERDSFNLLKSRLEEYQKYKEIGKLLFYKAIENSQIFYRPRILPGKEDFVLDVDIFNLMSCFKKILKELPDNVREIIYDEIPIEVKEREILAILEGKQYILFSEFLRIQKSRNALIVSFMAVLELTKKRQIAVKQTELFGEIRIYRIYDCVRDDLQNKPQKQENEKKAVPNLKLLTGSSGTNDNSEL